MENIHSFSTKIRRKDCFLYVGKSLSLLCSLEVRYSVSVTLGWDLILDVRQFLNWNALQGITQECSMESTFFGMLAPVTHKRVLRPDILNMWIQKVNLIFYYRISQKFHKWDVFSHQEALFCGASPGIQVLWDTLG